MGSYVPVFINALPSRTPTIYMREANEVANDLAKKFFSERTSKFWDSTFPDFISYSLVNDRCILSLPAQHCLGLLLPQPLPSPDDAPPLSCCCW